MDEILQPQRTLAELKELRTLTGDSDGAQRVAFSPVWEKSRAWLRNKLSELPVDVEQDEAGNLWATLSGESEQAILIGSHIDSVPNGGWLDGCLGVMAGLEVIRRFAYEGKSGGKPRFTMKLVDWCDEEGARFGRSLFGSSAVSGALNVDSVRSLTDRNGDRLEEVVKRCGIELSNINASQSRIQNAVAYVELHIEQGPVLEGMNLAMGAVQGTYGVERHTITFTGQAAHSGSTPMAYRRDALSGVSRLHLAIREIAVKYGGVCTVGSVKTKPGIVTAVVGEAEMTLDQRHLSADSLAAMYHDAKEASYVIAKEEKIEVAWKTLWQIQPFLFHPDLIELANQSIVEICGKSHKLPSGPLHDAAEVCRTGVPTIMLFVQSLYGISHNKIEDTREEHLVASVQTLDRLVQKITEWLASRQAVAAE